MFINNHILWDKIMKEQLSITVNKDVLTQVEQLLIQKGIFRNKSHIFEYAVRKLLEEKNE